MPAGLQVFDQFGNIKTDISHRLLRFIGDPVYIGPGDSAFVINDGLLTGTPSYVTQMYYNDGVSYWPGEAIRGPSVSFSGNRMDYSLMSGSGTHIIQMVVY